MDGQVPQIWMLTSDRRQVARDFASVEEAKEHLDHALTDGAILAYEIWLGGEVIASKDRVGHALPFLARGAA